MEYMKRHTALVDEHRREEQRGLDLELRALEYGGGVIEQMSCEDSEVFKP